MFIISLPKVQSVQGFPLQLRQHLQSLPWPRRPHMVWPTFVSSSCTSHSLPYHAVVTQIPLCSSSPLGSLSCPCLCVHYSLGWAELPGCPHDFSSPAHSHSPYILGLISNVTSLIKSSLTILDKASLHPNYCFLYYLLVYFLYGIYYY